MREWVACLPRFVRDYLTEDALRDMTELRLRVGQTLEICRVSGRTRAGMPLTASQFLECIDCLAEHSLYASQNRLDEGYFIARGGVRVGVAGRFAQGHMTRPSSACIRVPREVIGAADRLLPLLTANGARLPSTLILSAPRMGKTTLLRDMARLLSERGHAVAIADERGEIAACVDGVPAMRLGACADVLDGVEKRLAIPMLVRSMAPEIVVADEIGGEGDALALTDAIRCGVTVLATAHARDAAQASRRAWLREAMDAGAFQKIVELGDSPGEIRRVVSWNPSSREG